jgi:hypothetical protein
MVPQSIRELMEVLEHIKKHILLTMLEMDPTRPPSLLNHPRGRWTPTMIGFQRNATLRSMALYSSNMGVHIPPTTLQTARSMISMAPLIVLSKGGRPT